MKPTKIETNYGKFPSMIHFERYWEERVNKAYRDGFDKGYRYFKVESLHREVSYE